MLSVWCKSVVEKRWTEVLDEQIFLYVDKIAPEFSLDETKLHLTKRRKANLVQLNDGELKTVILRLPN